MSETNDHTYVFEDTNRPLNERVKDFISQLTLEEKLTQLLHTSKAIPRLGVPEYDWWNECHHGVGRAGLATVFPQAIGLAATFDEDLIFRIASAISDEARAKYNAAVKIDNRNRYRGLTFWSPNINIFRDPRWGRGQETYGEDPYLTSILGVAFVKGLQGDDPDYLKVAACAKHFAVHSGPEKLRHQFNAKVSDKDLYETYLPAFKALVDAGVESVMGAYNRTNDEPCCGSNFLLKEILRKKWNFKGHVVSDCWAIRDFHVNHHITDTPEESVALALNNGCDLNCGCIFERGFLLNAINRKLITEAAIDEALGHLFTTRFKLGMFDPPEKVPFSKLGEEVIDCQKHRDLAYEAAVKSIVLLQNKNGLLPLGHDLKTIYVFGANAMDIELLLGNYNGYSSKMTSIMEGIVGKAGKGTSVVYKRAHLPNYSEEIDQGFMGEIKKADVFIAAIGITPQDEGEEGADAGRTGGEGDRKDITLPAYQIQFIKNLSKTGKPIILILTAGSQLALGDIQDCVDAILYVWYPGEEGGTAVGDILFGNISPSGKLPLTFPKSIDQIPDFKDYSMNNRTYRYMKEEPLYPFGFGLHYTSFVYGPVSLNSQTITANDSVKVAVMVTNSGNVSSDEVVQLYLQHKDVAYITPTYSLKGFQRIHLKAKEKKEVEFTITPEIMKLINNDGDSVLEKGRISLYIGGSSPGMRSIELGAPDLVEAEFRIT
ncbi:MAG: glycoside hydrolase family 3 C-terminal domain-containing protein [Spirochaetales bacterium]|nr:glycoside hydrolase family 3 C-terminal domain-containing protein [Spirochaetales bacterium]